MAYTTILIDLDDTVYPAGNGVWEAIGERIESYMHERMGLSPAEIPALRKEYHARFGTTLRGLIETRQIDELDYLAYVHDIPLARYLHPDPAARIALRSCPLRKIIFTNADRAHARRVLDVLELDGIFEDVIDIMDIRPYCKPMPQAYQIALEKVNARAEECVFLDDSPRNLLAAHELGITTVFVSQTPPSSPNGLWIGSLADLPNLYPAFISPK